MKYIKDASGGGWDLKSYFGYLDDIKDRLPADLFAFARNADNYDLMSHQSLHDAWLNSVLMIENATGSRSEIRKVSIECRFLGPYHDLEIILLYSNVSRYS